MPELLEVDTPLVLSLSKGERPGSLVLWLSGSLSPCLSSPK